MKPQLSGSHRTAHDAVLRHPTASNVSWRDVRSMFGALADVVEEPNGNLKITCSGQTLVLHPSLDKDVAEIEELMEIRRFLERSGAASPEAEAGGPHLLIVMGRCRAPVYETEAHRSVPQRVTPYDPSGFGPTPALCHAPKAVTVVLSQDTLVVTLHEALSPAERAMARSPAGAAKVQEFHRQLFSSSCQSLREEIERITGVALREAVAEVEPSSGAVVQAFTSSAMVQVFRLAQNVPDGSWSGGAPDAPPTVAR